MPDQPTDAGKDRETAQRLAFDLQAVFDKPEWEEVIAHALADARAEADRDWRQALWLGHGHLGLYGDDGEMQCAKCRPMWDYKRGSIFDTVHAALAAARREGQAQEGELLDLLEAASAFLFYGGWKSDKKAAEMKRRITAALKAREEPSR